VKRSFAYALVAAMATGSLSISLAGCAPSAQPEVEAVEPTHASLTDDGETLQPSTSSQPDAEQGGSAQPALEQSDAEQRAALDRYVEAERAQIPVLLEATNQAFTDLRIESQSLDSTTYTFVFANQTDPVVASQAFDALVPTLKASFDSLTLPAMRAAGVQGTVHATYVYLNADNSSIWEKTFTSSD